MMEASVSQPSEIDRATACITQAFAADPLWSVALARDDGRTDHHAPYWRFLVESAVRFGGVRQWNSGEAYSIWIPPGESEISPDLEEAANALVKQSLSADGLAALHQLYERFEAFREEVPKKHAYLAILATHKDHGGRGVGQVLMAAGLAEWDALDTPTRLESSNPVNNHRYVRAGFQPVGEFTAVLDDAKVTTMWRPVGGAQDDTFLKSRSQRGSTSASTHFDMKPPGLAGP